MNKRILLTIGSITAVAIPIATVISCGNNSHEKSNSSNLPNKSTLESNIKAAINTIETIELPLKDDENHKTELYNEIINEIKNAKDTINEQKTIENVDKVLNESIKKITDKIAEYQFITTSEADKKLGKLKEISVIDLSLKTTSTNFFTLIKNEIEHNIKKEIDINEFLTEVGSDGEVIVSARVGKHQYHKIIVKGINNHGFNLVQQKIIIRLFANQYDYERMSTGMMLDKFELKSKNNIITLTKKNSNWLLTNKDKKITNKDVTKEIEKLDQIGSKHWAYIQTILLKEINEYDLVIKAISQNSIGIIGDVEINLNKQKY